MKFIETKSAQAIALLAVIKAMFENLDSNTEVFIKDFNNCREQGYVLELKYVDGKYLFSEDTKIWVAFAENRNSDDIVVYYNDNSYEDLQSVDWDKKEYFRYGQFTQAADYIKSLFDETIEKVREESNNKEELGV